MREDEREFKALIGQMVAEGTYPEHRLLVSALRRQVDQTRSGLSVAQSVWRREVVEAAGFDWEASKRARSLVRPKKPLY